MLSTGDARILFAARSEARSKFESNRGSAFDSSATQQKIAEAEEVARILRQNIVQGEPIEGTKPEEQKYRALPILSRSSVSYICGYTCMRKP